jgi:AcrR family transcriptional regulator
MSYVECLMTVNRYVAAMVGEQGPQGRREEYTEATRRALLDAGRETFARDGYAAAGIETISRSARVTRGAFYHHFTDKLALFDAVVVELQAEAAQAILARSRGHDDRWERLFVGIDAFLDACLEPAYGRIVVREAPVVLGYARFREIEEAYPMALLLATLESLEKHNVLQIGDTLLLCRMADAMICKIALMLPEASDQTALRARGKAMIVTFLETYRTRPAA